jgi:hypothetical protein
MLSTDPAKTKDVVFGYRPQAKDSDKLVDKEFLNDMMKSLGYASSLFEKRPDELFPKSLAELKVNIYFMLGYQAIENISSGLSRQRAYTKGKKDSVDGQAVDGQAVDDQAAVNCSKGGSSTSKEIRKPSGLAMSTVGYALWCYCIIFCIIFYHFNLI